MLGSWPLRSVANQLAYADTDAFATDDAIRVGLLHTARPAWEDDSVAWLLGGGYSVSSLVPRLAPKPAVILWGRQDEILPPAEYAPKFVAALPGAAFRWVEDCGHSPHLEQPAIMAQAIRATLDGSAAALSGDLDTSEVVALSERGPLEKLQAQWQELNALLDKPILDTGERGGPLEPLKKFARTNPEQAQIGASVVAVLFWLGLAKVVGGLFL